MWCPSPFTMFSPTKRGTQRPTICKWSRGDPRPGEKHRTSKSLFPVTTHEMRHPNRVFNVFDLGDYSDTKFLTPSLCVHFLSSPNRERDCRRVRRLWSVVPGVRIGRRVNGTRPTQYTRDSVRRPITFTYTWTTFCLTLVQGTWIL